MPHSVSWRKIACSGAGLIEKSSTRNCILAVQRMTRRTDNPEYRGQASSLDAGQKSSWRKFHLAV